MQPDVYKVTSEAAADRLTVVFRSQGVFQGRKKWRLVCADAATAAKVRVVSGGVDVDDVM